MDFYSIVMWILWVGIPAFVVWLVTLLALLFIKVMAKRRIDGPTFLRQALFAIPIAAVLFAMLVVALLSNAKL